MCIIQGLGTVNNKKPELYGALALAFIGDGVYELLVRDRILKNGTMPPNKLHKKAIEYVKAQAQSEAVELIYDKLTEEECEIYKRGRNSGKINAPKNADVIEYRRATGLEALFGYLYLKKRYQRINELFNIIYPED